MISRYSFTTIGKSETGKQVYNSIQLPEIPERDDDIYIITNTTDRLDSLAYKFYGEPKYWWVIAIANNISDGRITVGPGIQLRIPANPSSVISDLENSNL